METGPNDISDTQLRDLVLLAGYTYTAGLP